MVHGFFAVVAAVVTSVQPVVLSQGLARAAGAQSLVAGKAKATVLFFVMSDCPISNFYAPEIQRLCADYNAKGITCALVYEDVGIDERAVRKHVVEYRYNGIVTVIDRERAIARKAGATVTPQAVVFGARGDILYRGRIDNRYEAFGKPRRVVTEHDLREALDAVLAGKRVKQPDGPAIGCSIVSPDILRKRP